MLNETKQQNPNKAMLYFRGQYFAYLSATQFKPTARIYLSSFMGPNVVIKACFHKRQLLKIPQWG